jgi:hypothetical protein
MPRYEGLVDMKVWEVWDRGFGPPEDYDAIYKNAQSPTTLHFPPLRPRLKNISKIYFCYQTILDGI